LIAVAKDNRLDKVMLQLASWGYNTPLDKEMALKNERIELIDLNCLKKRIKTDVSI